MAFSANRDESVLEAFGRALMWLRSSDIMTPQQACEVSGRAQAHARSKPGVFALAQSV
jgi:hypothetical protein